MNQLKLTVDVTGTEQFRNILETLHFAYKHADEETRTAIRLRVEAILGQTHCLDQFDI